jgi:HSP20 family protein
MFDNFYGSPLERSLPSNERAAVFSPVLESGWTDDALFLRAIVPGVPESEIKVTVQNNQLVIEGERKAPEGFERSAFTQLAYGRFYTAVTLPNGLDLDKLVCRLHEGVLDVRVPLAEASKPRQIRIETGETRKSISA